MSKPPLNRNSGSPTWDIPYSIPLILQSMIIYGRGMVNDIAYVVPAIILWFSLILIFKSANDYCQCLTNLKLMENFFFFCPYNFVYYKESVIHSPRLRLV